MTHRYSDEQYLAADQRLACEVVTPTARERYRKALAERTALTAQVERLRRELDPAVHTTADPADLLRRITMARELLPGAVARLRSAIEKCMALRPAPQPRRRAAPSPVVWLNTPPSRSRTTARDAPAYLIRDMASLHFKTADDWLRYSAATTGQRRRGRP